MKGEINDLSLLTIKDACNLLGKSSSTIYKLINAGKIRYIQVNKRINIPYYELKRFIDESLCQYTNITNNDLFSSDVDSTPVPEFDTNKILDKILEKYNGKRL